MTLEHEGLARLMILTVRNPSLVKLLLRVTLSVEPRSSPASARGLKPMRGSRGTRRSQLQEVSIPMVTRGASKTSVDDVTEDDENDDEAEGNEHTIKQASRVAAKSVTKPKKRRSARRR